MGSPFVHSFQLSAGQCLTPLNSNKYYYYYYYYYYHYYYYYYHYCCMPAHQDPKRTFWGIFILLA